MTGTGAETGSMTETGTGSDSETVTELWSSSQSTSKTLVCRLLTLPAAVALVCRLSNQQWKRLHCADQG